MCLCNCNEINNDKPGLELVAIPCNNLINEAKYRTLRILSRTWPTSLDKDKFLLLVVFSSEKKKDKRWPNATEVEKEVGIPMAACICGSIMSEKVSNL